MWRVRALVISDTHFGAWTGDDILSQPDTVALLEPHLDVDEVIFLGDMFDFMFGSLRDAFHASERLRNDRHGQRRAFAACERLGRAARMARAPAIGIEHAGDWVARYVAGAARRGLRRDTETETETEHYRDARRREAERQRRTG